jgi:hypothetical protein
MQAPTRLDPVTLARGRARKWLRVFQQLVRVLDRLEQKQQSLLAASMVYLVQKALGNLEAIEPAVPVDGNDREAVEGVEADGEELVSAVTLSRDKRPRSEMRDDPANDELEVLLVLSGALVECDEPCRFDDLSVTDEVVIVEYRKLQQSSTDDVKRDTLFPALFRSRWAGLVEAATKTSDLRRRLTAELSIRKVINALFAMAIGYRRAADFEESRTEHDAWLAWSIGESALKGVRR